MHKVPTPIGLGRVTCTQPYPHMQGGYFFISKHDTQVTIEQLYCCIKAHTLCFNYGYQIINAQQEALNFSCFYYQYYSYLSKNTINTLLMHLMHKRMYQGIPYHTDIELIHNTSSVLSINTLNRLSYWAYQNCTKMVPI